MAFSLLNLIPSYAKLQQERLNLIADRHRLEKEMDSLKMSTIVLRQVVSLSKKQELDRQHRRIIDRYEMRNIFRAGWLSNAAADNIKELEDNLETDWQYYKQDAIKYCAKMLKEALEDE